MKVHFGMIKGEALQQTPYLNEKINMTSAFFLGRSLMLSSYVALKCSSSIWMPKVNFYFLTIWDGRMPYNSVLDRNFVHKKRFTFDSNRLPWIWQREYKRSSHKSDSSWTQHRMTGGVSLVHQVIQAKQANQRPTNNTDHWVIMHP